MTNFYIKAKEAKQMADALAFCMMDEKAVTRHYLKGIFIHNKEKRLFAAATDGHRLGRMWLVPYGTDGTREEPLVEDFGFIMPRDAVAWLGKLELPKRSDLELMRFTLNEEEVTLTLLPDNQSASFPLIDGGYPDYERLIPQRKPSDTMVGFNARYLAELGKAAEKATGIKGTPLTLHISGPDDACVVTCDHQRLLYIQMPVRV